jgi:hypothetical protein
MVAMNVIDSGTVTTFEDAAHAVRSFGTAMVSSAVNLADYMSRTTSEEENLANVTALLENQFQHLGVSVPQSTDELRSLIQNIDWTTESGRHLAASVSDVLPYLEAYISYMEQTGESLEDLAKKRELELEIMRLQGREEEYLAAVRADSLAQLSEGNQVLQQQVWELEDAKEAEDARVRAIQSSSAASSASAAASAAASEAEAQATKERALHLEIIRLEGHQLQYINGVRADELEGLNETNKAMQERVWALQDEAAIAEEARSMEIELMRLEGQEYRALNAERHDELMALNEANRPLQERIWALQEEQEAMAETEASIQSYVDAMLSITDMLDSTRKGIEEFGLTDKEVYERRKAEADVLMDALGEMSDPQMIQDTVSRINALIGEGWGMLDDSQKELMKDQFLAYLDEIQSVAEERIAVGLAPHLEGKDVSLEGSLAASSAGFENSSIEMREAAREMASAAVEMRQAARSIPTSVSVSVREREVQ